MAEFFNLLKGATITLPVLELFILILTLTICLTWRYTKVGLVAAYLCAYHWGWVFFAKQSTVYFGIYLIMGGLVLTLSIIEMLVGRHRDS